MGSRVLQIISALSGLEHLPLISLGYIGITHSPPFSPLFIQMKCQQHTLWLFPICDFHQIHVLPSLPFHTLWLHLPDIWLSSLHTAPAPVNTVLAIQDFTVPWESGIFMIQACGFFPCYHLTPALASGCIRIFLGTSSNSLLLGRTSLWSPYCT